MFKKLLLFILVLLTFACSSGPAKLGVVNASQIKELTVLNGHEGGINAVVFSPDGTLLISGDGSSSIRIWDVNQAKELKALEGPTSHVADMVLYPNGTTVAAITSNWTEDQDFRKFRLWDIKTYEEIAAPTNVGQGEADDVRPADAMAISHDGKLLALNTCSGSVSLNSDGSLSCQFTGVRLVDAATGDSVNQLPQTFEATVWRMAFNPDSSLLAASAGDGTVRLFNVQGTPDERVLLRVDYRALGIAFSADGKLLAVGLGDGTVHLFDVATGNETAVLTGQTEPAISVAFSPDGTLLASGSADNLIRVWNVATKELLKSLGGHTDYVFSIAFNPDGTKIASGSYDKTIRIWGL